eukprot:9121422-Lingulodinium_polyedra.AAC.1
MQQMFAGLGQTRARVCASIICSQKQQQAQRVAAAREVGGVGIPERKRELDVKGYDNIEIFACGEEAR